MSLGKKLRGAGYIIGTGAAITAAIGSLGLLAGVGIGAAILLAAGASESLFEEKGPRKKNERKGGKKYCPPKFSNKSRCRNRH